MATSTIHEARTPVMRLVAIQAAPKQREPGMFKGEFEVGDAFFEPLPDDELEA